MNVENITQITPQEVIDPLKEGIEIYTNLTEKFIKEFTFYDKTLYEWTNLLFIKIPHPSQLDILSFRECLLRLSKNIQLASNYYSLACSMVETISGGNSIKKSDLINAIVTNYANKGAKRPAASVIESMAESYLSSTTSAEKAAKIVKSFWKQRLDTLLDLRKVFEQIGMSLSVELKHTS